jgi:HEAT repeat protein
VRDALAQRLTDPHDDTRCEALAGLAHRRDPRALPVVIAALQTHNPFSLEIQAAGALGDPQLHPLLEGHLTGWDRPEDARIAEAAWRLTDPDGLGDDLIAGLADAVRAIAAGERADLREDPWWVLFLAIENIDPSGADQTARHVDAALAGDPAGRAELRRTWLGQRLPPAVENSGTDL